MPASFPALNNLEVHRTLGLLNLAEFGTFPPSQLQPKPPTAEGAKAPTPREVSGQLLPATRGRNRPSNAERLAIRPDGRILQQLREYSAETNRTMTSIIEIALLDYFDVHAPKRGRLGAKAPIINKDLRKEIRNLSSIARLFHFWAAAYNAHSRNHRAPWKPSWTDRDAVCEEEIRGYDERTIELSMIRVVMTKELGGPRIVSFRYFLPQIFEDYDKQTTTLEKKLDWMLAHYRMKAATFLKIPFADHWELCECGHHGETK